MTNPAVEALKKAQEFLDGIQEGLFSSRAADWYPEGANNAALAMSEAMRLIGNMISDFTVIQDALAQAEQTPVGGLPTIDQVRRILEVHANHTIAAERVLSLFTETLQSPPPSGAKASGKESGWVVSAEDWAKIDASMEIMGNILDGRDMLTDEAELKVVNDGFEALRASPSFPKEEL